MVLLLPVTSVSAQKKQFDVFHYLPPAGYQRLTTSGYLGFQKNEGRNYCQLFLYPVAAGTGNPATDFEKAWDFFARKPAEKVNSPETLQTDTVEGWTVTSGTAKGVFNRQPYALLLNSFSRGNIQFIMAFVYTKEMYSSAIQQFISGIEPDEARLKEREKSLAASPATQSAPVAGSARPTAMKITNPETRFQDGTVARAFFDYLQVVKNGVEGRIYFPTAELDRSTEPLNGRRLESRYWDFHIAPYFTYPEIRERQRPPNSFGEEAIWEAQVTEKSTGKKSWLAMQLSWENGNCTVFVALAPDANSLYQQFPNTEAFTALTKYNQFSATGADMVGTWSSYGASAMSYYYASTGLYAGTATAHISDKFEFRADGSYESSHAATTTYNTRPSYFAEKCRGRYTATPWSVRITNRHPSDPGDFHCQFEAVRGGYVLRLVNKKFTGNNIVLVKVK